jgi:predicted RecA/RadA family phage recombinase
MKGFNMSNFNQPGDVVTYTALAVTAVGDIVATGLLSGVALNNAEIGEEVEVALSGVFTLNRENDAIATFGLAAYKHAVNNTVTTTVGTNKFIGHFIGIYGAGTTPVKVRLVQSEA